MNQENKEPKKNDAPKKNDETIKIDPIKDNIEFLQNQVKFLGFGEKHHTAIEENIKAGKKEFSSVDKEEYPNRQLTSTLQFSKSNTSDRTFLNHFDAVLLKADGREESQRFYVNMVKTWDEEKGKDVYKTAAFTKKEASNLLDRDNEGNTRAVFKQYYNKEGEPYMAWKALDLDTVDKNGNHPIRTFSEYDMDKPLRTQGVLEMHNPQNADDLMKSLYKGNEQAVTVMVDGEKVRRFAVADPEREDLILYNNKHQLMYRRETDVVIVNPNRPGDTSEELKGSVSEKIEGKTNGVQEGKGNDKAITESRSNGKQELLDKGTTADKGSELLPKTVKKKEAAKLNKSDELMPKKRQNKGQGQKL